MGLLIVPRGIEMFTGTSIPRKVELLLIVPRGIETFILSPITNYIFIIPLRQNCNF